MIEWDDHPQNSEGWYKEKIGKPSASGAKEIATTTGEPSTSAKKYLYRLASEIVTGEFTHGYYNDDMRRGHEQEDEARALYGLVKRVDVRTPAICYKNERKEYLASTDGLIETTGVLELKNALPKIQADRIDNGWGSKSKSHYQQCQMALFVTGYEWIDLMSYCRKMKPVIRRCYPDPKWQDKFKTIIYKFNKDLKETVEKIR